MDEGTFVGWLKKDGESVKAGEALFTLEGDKATQEVEATESGILRIPTNAPKAGDVVKVGAVLGYLCAENDSQETGDRGERTGVRGKGTGERGQETEVGCDLTSAPCSLTPGPPLATARRASRPAISPRARRLAAELGVDYSHLRGSGRSGRIIEADVLAAAQKPPLT